VTRILPHAEWRRLPAIQAFWEQLAPETTRIVVVERDGVIVGHHVLTVVLHAECLWIAPDERHGRVANRLWAAVQRAVRAEYGVGGFVTQAIDDRVRGLLRHVGAVPVPGESYFVPVKGQS
jgi:hypothetical protein